MRIKFTEDAQATVCEFDSKGNSTGNGPDIAIPKDVEITCTKFTYNEEIQAWDVWVELSCDVPEITPIARLITTESRPKEV